MKSHRGQNEADGGATPRRRWWRFDIRRAAPPHQPDLEPAHDQPWIPRSAFTDRLRHSPRR